jgi:hypothetical protein
VYEGIGLRLVWVGRTALTTEDKLCRIVGELRAINDHVLQIVNRVSLGSRDSATVAHRALTLRELVKYIRVFFERTVVVYLVFQLERVLVQLRFKFKTDSIHFVVYIKAVI